MYSSSGADNLTRSRSAYEEIMASSLSVSLYGPDLVGLLHHLLHTFDISWKYLTTTFIVLLISLRFALMASADDFKQSCLDFEPELYVQHSTRSVLEYVPAGTTLLFPDNDVSCARPSQVVHVDLCRLALTISTSDRSSVVLEMWLPRGWTGRYLATGNGGIDGCIKYEDLAYTTQYGFATTGSNNGHDGTGGLAFLNNPEVVADFAHRSLHTNVLAGKKLIKKFYKKSYTKSYYLGCSQGGRQGVHTAELYPEDFDGVVAGCPALNANYLTSWRASFYPITGSHDAPGFIQAVTWTGLIHTEVLRQCDGLDGVLDSIIEVPSRCNFRPEALLCLDVTSINNTHCLTARQVDIVKKVYSPMYGEEGQLIFPGLQPGAELLAYQKLLSGMPFQYSADWFKYVIYSDPDWDPTSFTIHDAAVSEATNPSNIRTWPSSLAPYQHAGGKLIIYHGGQDNQITSLNTERFYNYLSAEMGSSSSELDYWFRFFRVSGMFHCNMGPGAWSFGQGGVAAVGIPFDPQVNVLAAMVHWVEDGKAPDSIEGTKFVNDAPVSGVAFRRRHCRYPLRNTFVGGDYILPSSWLCM